MKKVHIFPMFRGALSPARLAITFALLLGASSLSPMFANPLYTYTGTDVSGIKVVFTIESDSAAGGQPASVTGSMSDGNSSCSGKVENGTLMMNGLAAAVMFNLQGFPAVSTMTGRLTGTLGVPSSMLNVEAFLQCNATPVVVDVDLSLQQINTTVNPGGGITLPPIILPQSETMTGQYSLGTTWSETLRLTTNLQGGSSYDVVGTITVNQFFGCPLVPNCTPHSAQTILNFSGVLQPGVQSQLTIHNPPAGSNAQLYGKISSSGTSFSGIVEGMPSLGINYLAVVATPWIRVRVPVSGRNLRAAVSRHSGFLAS